MVYVIGNHEYYGSSLSLIDELSDSKWQHAGIHLLEKDVLELPGLRILGCTLWSEFDLYGQAETHMEIAKNRINDYRLIREKNNKMLKPDSTRQFHRESVQWLDTELGKPFAGKPWW